jgi:CRISPR-associated protein Csb2
LLGLDAPVLPLVTQTIEVAEEIRVRLMGCHKAVVGDPRKVSSKFSGKDLEGEPLKSHHHCFILPRGNERGRIDRVLIYSRDPAGFDSGEIQAILRVRELRGRASDKPIRVLATWRGSCDSAEIRPGTTHVLSTTPFVAGRYWRQGRGEFARFLEEELRRECRNHGLPEPTRVEMLVRAPGLFEWVEFRRNRKSEAPRPGYGFRLEFEENVSAPFSLGYGCHFGLGQFDSEG